MSLSPDPYEKWMNDSVAAVPMIAPVREPQETPSDLRRGQKLLLGVFGALVALLVTAVFVWQYTVRVAAENLHARQYATEAAVEADDVATQRAAAESKAVTDLAVRQAASLTKDDAANASSAVGRANAARILVEDAAARSQSATAAVHSAPGEQLEQLARTAKNARKAAETALAQVRSDANVVREAVERQILAEEAERAVQQQAQVRAVELQQRLQAEIQMKATEAEHDKTAADLAGATNRALWRPDLALVVLVDPSNRPNWGAMDEMADRLTQTGRAASGRVLTSGFFELSIARELIEQGPASVLPRLNLKANRLVIGRLESHPQPPDANGFTTTDCIGSVTIFTGEGAVLGSIGWRGAGAAKDPRTSAEQALTKAWNEMDWKKLTALLAP